MSTIFKVMTVFAAYLKSRVPREGFGEADREKLVGDALWSLRLEGEHFEQALRRIWSVCERSQLVTTLSSGFIRNEYWSTWEKFKDHFDTLSEDRCEIFSEGYLLGIAHLLFSSIYHGSDVSEMVGIRLNNGLLGLLLFPDEMFPSDENLEDALVDFLDRVPHNSANLEDRREFASLCLMALSEVKFQKES